MLKLDPKESSSEGTYQLAVKHMDKDLVEIMKIKANIAKSSYLEQGLLEWGSITRVPLLQGSSEFVKDPPQSNCKGRKRVQRYKSPSEPKGKKSRTCKRCNQKGHNIRNCKAKVIFKFYNVLCYD